MKRRLYRLVSPLFVGCLFLPLLLVLPGATPAAAAVDDPRPSIVYFSATGHHLGWSFLTFWRQAGGLPVLGYPISEEFTENGRTVQYFQRGRLEYYPELAASPFEVQLGLIEQQMLISHEAFPHSAPQDWQLFPETGYSLSSGFKQYYYDHGGVSIFGYPLSDEVQLDDTVVQYFQRARFERHPDGSITLGLVGWEYALAKGINTVPVTRIEGVPDYDPSYWPEDYRIIVVSLRTQRLQAIESGQVVKSTPISSGIAKHPTPPGVYRIEFKVLTRDMKGGSKEDGDYYDLPNVPYVLFFRRDGYAIHGTYWHHNFGHPMSHGCVNAPTPFAQWLYDWAPVGTKVVITQS